MRIYPFLRVRIRAFERGLLFVHQTPERLLAPGLHWIFDPSLRVRVDVVEPSDLELEHQHLDRIFDALDAGHPVLGAEGEVEAEAFDVGSHQRALLWENDRVVAFRGPGRHIFWTGRNGVRAEIFDTDDPVLRHPRIVAIRSAPGSAALLESVEVPAGTQSLLFRDGALLRALEPGTYALWRDAGRQRLVSVDSREQILDVAGQEMLTADKVTLRINALATYRVRDAETFVLATDNAPQALYREVQMALRETVGTRDLDTLLSAKDELAAEMSAAVRQRAQAFGLELLDLGIKDLILPGEMRVLMNQVMEARKAAEAQLITRREETAALRSQANTARFYERHPTLMKLRELEVLEKVAETADLKVVLGDSGLSDRLTHLI